MTEEKSYRYKFSVVIPIYNVEDYIEETILSVINQTIGFKDNIQMILVNDGSPDKSEEICLEYREKYPENIVYVKQENCGVSSARNNGINYVEGKYINFLDSDDKWDLDSFEKVYSFFEKNKDSIDVVACRIKFFENKTGFSHALDYKFNKDKVISIFDDYNHIQLSSASVFFKQEVIKKHRYDTKLKYTEDGKLLAYIILEKEKYGLMRSAVYNYRKRFVGNSAIDSGSNDESWYIDTVEKCYKDLFIYSIKKYGKVISYIQYQIMYDLQWRLKIKIKEDLPKAYKIKYVEDLKWLLENIEDYIICNQKKMVMELKIYALNLKYDRQIVNDLFYDTNKLYFNNICLHSLKSEKLFNINIMDIEGNKLLLEGKIKTILPRKDYHIYLLDNFNNRYELEYYDINFDNKYAFNGEEILKTIGFKVSIPLSGIASIKAIIEYKKKYNKKINLQFGKFGKIVKKYNKSYYHNKSYIIKHNKNTLSIKKYKKRLHIKYELIYLAQLLKHKKYKVIGYRILYYLMSNLTNKNIWIITDRTHAANDNGMYLFKYINSFKYNKQHKIYFAIDKKCNDYKLIKKYGKVLDINSLKYKLYFLMSSKIISSHADEWVINAFDKKRELLKDLYKFDFVFLQHGITKDDLSSWLHKQNKNIKLFITSVNNEYEAIIKGGYGYKSQNVKLTGFPRFDYLKDDKEKQIVIMPTWRKSIAKEPIKGTSLRKYDSNFKNTNYYKFYNDLINDKRLIDILYKTGYNAKFCIHPSFEMQAVDFKENKYVQISNQIPDYQKEFTENSLLITDYSSVAFDFSYLKKPIIYTQFDVNEFFNGHSYDKGYFDYERDGFGYVCYDYETSIQKIIEAIKNECKIDDKYLDRINKFYCYNDKNNCERVYKAIKSV